MELLDVIGDLISIIQEYAGELSPSTDSSQIPLKNLKLKYLQFMLYLLEIGKPYWDQLETKQDYIDRIVNLRDSILLLVVDYVLLNYLRQPPEDDSWTETDVKILAYYLACHDNVQLCERVHATLNPSILAQIKALGSPVGEICKPCRAPIPFEHLFQSQCSKNHKWRKSLVDI
jgi:hypothetical protein